MVKTLGSLVVAMTGTAALLNWLSATLPPSAVSLPTDQILLLAEVVATQDVAVQGRRWRKVHVAPQVDTQLATSLVATPAADKWHFRIRSDGHPFASRSWRLQRPVDPDPHSIQIRVDVPATREAISEAQWFCIRELAASVRRATAGADNQPIPIVLQAS